MKSYCIKEYGAPLEMVEMATPSPKGDEILLEVSGCGVCHSDIHILEPSGSSVTQTYKQNTAKNCLKIKF